MALEAWLYRKSVTLSRASGAVTNYQMKVLVGESSGATGEDVNCGGLCKSDFSDLRFTNSAIAVLDCWIESVSGTTPNQLATIWVKFDSIGTGATTFYMYYGNADAPAVSSGANTFIVFDDFERGSNGDTIGGAWTEDTAHVHISTEQAYAGTRSAKIVGGTDAVATISVTPSADISIQWRARKEDTADMAVVHNDGGSRAQAYWGTDETYKYYSSSSSYTAFSPSPISPTKDAWHLFEMNDFNWTTNTADWWVDGTKCGNDSSQYSDAFQANKFWIRGASAGGGSTFFDHFLIRNWRAIEPAWGLWGGYGLSGWIYYKSVTLSRASGAVTNYQMKVLVGESSGVTGSDVHCAGHVKSDFSDLRFTNSIGAVLDYYIESVSGTTPNQLATIWVKFDSIGTGATTFYMYYGNADATAASNGPNTFIFFEDFNNLNTADLNGQNGWTGHVTWDVGTTTKYEGAKAATAAAGGTTVNVSKTIPSRPYTWNIFMQARMQHSNVTIGNGLDIYFRESGNSITAIAISSSQMAALVTPPQWVNIGKAVSNNTWYKVVLTINSTSTHQTWVDDILYTPANVSNMTTISSTIDAILLEQYSAGGAAFVDQIIVGQYLTTGPSWGLWGIEFQSRITTGPLPLYKPGGWI
jgi:hypothetical protein